MSKTIADLTTFVSGYPAGTNKFIQSGFNSTVAQAKIDRKKEEAHAFATNLEEGQHDYENSAANNSATITSRLLCSLHQGVTIKNSSFLRLILIVAVISGSSVLQGCVSPPEQQSTPAPVPTVLSSGESDWVCPGVPRSAALHIRGDRFDENQINIENSEVELRSCYIWKILKKDGGSFLSTMWGTSTKIEEASGYSFDENSSVFDRSEVKYHIEGVDGEGALVEPSSGIMHATWKCSSFKRGIVVKILFDPQKEHPRNLTEDAINFVKLIRSWACGEIELPEESTTGSPFESRQSCSKLNEVAFWRERVLEVDTPLAGGMFVSGAGFRPSVPRDAVARAIADKSASAVAGDMGDVVGR